MDNYRRFKFVKEYVKSESEKIPKDSELTVLNDKIFFNGGMVTPANYFLLKGLIESEIKSPNYLEEVPIPRNKI